MTAYRIWTLTCDACGEIFDNGSPYSLVAVRSDARRHHGWETGKTAKDPDRCSVCIALDREVQS